MEPGMRTASRLEDTSNSAGDVMEASGTTRPEASSARGFPPLVEAMMRPGFYPDSPARVELKQTHISYVFVAGDFVYKVKKPVRFAFLDCSQARPAIPLLPRGGAFKRASVAACVPGSVRDSEE